MRAFFLGHQVPCIDHVRILSSFARILLMHPSLVRTAVYSSRQPCTVVRPDTDIFTVYARPVPGSMRQTGQHNLYDKYTIIIVYFEIIYEKTIIVFLMPVEELAPAHCPTYARVVWSRFTTFCHTIFRIRYCTVFNTIQRQTRQCYFDAAPACRLNLFISVGAYGYEHESFCYAVIRTFHSGSRKNDGVSKRLSKMWLTFEFFKPIFSFFRIFYFVGYFIIFNLV